MDTTKLPPLELPPTENGIFALIPALWDLGGAPGTASGALWLNEKLRLTEIQSLINTHFQNIAPIRFDYIFARLEPGLLVAAQTLKAWQSGYRPFWLFGDHGLSIGPVRAASLHDRPITVFMFDAHPDQYDGGTEQCGGTLPLRNEVHQGNIGKSIAFQKAVRKLILVGVRQPLSSQELDNLTNVEQLSAQYIMRYPVPAQQWIEAQLARAIGESDTIVLSIDLDVLDPNVFPATDNPVAGGLSLPTLLRLAVPVARCSCSIDISEFNPIRDKTFQGGKVVLELICELLRGAPVTRNRRTWLPLLSKIPSGILLPLSPDVGSIIDGSGNVLELNAAETALLHDKSMETLQAEFQEKALLRAAKSLRETLNKAACGREATANQAQGFAATGRRLRPSSWLSGGGGHIEGLAVSANGQWVAAADWDHCVYMWSISEPEKPIVGRGHEAWIISVSFSPDGSWLASASDDRSLGLWNVHDLGDPPDRSRAHDHWVKTLAWNPVGSGLASASFDGVVKLWSLTSCLPTREITAHPGIIWGLAWSPEGQTVATCGTEGMLRCWNSATGGLVAELSGHAGSVERCRYSSDGKLWSLGIKGHLVCHEGGPEPKMMIEAAANGLDLALMEQAGLILVADLHQIHCYSLEDLSPVRELEVDFPISSVVAWGDNHVAVAGDSKQIAVFELELG